MPGLDASQSLRPSYHIAVADLRDSLTHQVKVVSYKKEKCKTF